jgi:hypothetical protein
VFAIERFLCAPAAQGLLLLILCVVRRNSNGAISLHAAGDGVGRSDIFAHVPLNACRW